MTSRLSLARGACGRVALFMMTLTILLALTVKADFGCQDKWKGPSKDNNIVDCDLPQKYQKQYGDMVPPAIALLIFIFTLLIFPFFWCCRQVCKCCGSNRRRPGVTCCGGSEWDDRTAEEKEAMYTDQEITRTKMCTGVLWVLGIGCLVCMVLGAAYIRSSYNGFFEEVFGVVDWAQEQIKNIQTGMTLSDGNYVPGFPAEAVDSGLQGVADMRASLTSTKETADKYEQYVTYVSFAVGVIPIVLLIIGASFAVFDCRTCGPAFLTCWYFLFILIYSLLGVVFFVLGPVFSDVCDEIDLQLGKKPGVIQWWIVPTCQETLQFGSVNDSVRTAEQTASREGCTNFQRICDSSPVFNPLSPNKIYICNIGNATQQCTTLTDLEDVIFGATGKTGTGSLCSGGLPNSQCTVNECARSCTNTNNKEYANETVTQLDYANRSKSTYETYVVPLLSCDNLITRAVQPFTVCRTVVKAFYLTGAGATAYALFFIIGIGVQFRGQKRFFKRTKVVDPNEPTGAEPVAGIVLATEPAANEEEMKRRKV